MFAVSALMNLRQEDCQKFEDSYIMDYRRLYLDSVLQSKTKQKKKTHPKIRSIIEISCVYCGWDPSIESWTSLRKKIKFIYFSFFIPSLMDRSFRQQPI